MIRHEIHTLQASLIFFTRIPGNLRGADPRESLRHASRYFPFIGWVIGMIGAGVLAGGTLLFPPSLAILLSMTATILATGALHEDGFADFCDGFGGGWTKERILEIMKDSYIGVFGVIGLFLILGMKMLVLTSLPAAILPIALISGHSLSRFVSISLLFTHDYVRDDPSGKSRMVVKRMTRKEFLFVAITGILPFGVLCLMTSQWWLLGIELLVAGCLRWIFGRYLTAKIQGYTGDCLGALQQLAEVVFYLTLVAML